MVLLDRRVQGLLDVREHCSNGKQPAARFWWIYVNSIQSICFAISGSLQFHVMAPINLVPESTESTSMNWSAQGRRHTCEMGNYMPCFGHFRYIGFGAYAIHSIGWVSIHNREGKTYIRLESIHSNGLRIGACKRSTPSWSYRRALLPCAMNRSTAMKKA